MRERDEPVFDDKDPTGIILTPHIPRHEIKQIDDNRTDKRAIEKSPGHERNRGISKLVHSKSDDKSHTREKHPGKIGYAHTPEKKKFFSKVVMRACVV
jgi:hypothetical protein